MGLRYEVYIFCIFFQQPDQICFVTTPIPNKYFLLSGYTPLHIAACWGSRPCLEILVENGANLGARNIHGETARHAAMRYSMEECTQYLDWAGELIDSPRYGRL